MPGAAGPPVGVGQGISESPYGRKRGNALQSKEPSHVVELYGNGRITCWALHGPVRTTLSQAEK